MRDFRKLKVWSRGQAVAVAAYRVTRHFPASEMYGLTSQIRRSAASIPANIAEGSGRGGDVEFSRFLRIAMGSAVELQSHLMLARELEYLNLEQYREVRRGVEEVQRMLASLIRKLNAST
jgi:four helix bundle protein